MPGRSVTGFGIVRLCCLAAVGAAVINGGCTGTANEPVPKPVIRLSTGVPGGFFNPLGAALLQKYTEQLPAYAFTIVPSGGALTNLQVLQRGDADLGFAFADVTYLAFIGRLGGERARFDRLRGVAVLQPTAVHVVVRPASGIRSIDQLRGRAVALGPQGSGTAATAEVLLEAFGIHLGEVRGEYLPFVEAANRVVRGSLDAAFVSAGYPAESVQAATRAGAVLLEVSGPVVDRLRIDYPFLKTTLIPAGTYRSLDRSVHTVGIDTLIACRSSLDETVVYDLTKTFFEVLPALAARVDALRRMDLARAPATPIPLHEGAARYYRERELFR